MQDAIWDCVIGFLGTCGGMDGSRRCLPGPFFCSGANGLVSLRNKDEKRCLRIDSKAFCPYDRYPNVPEEHKRA